MLARNIARLGLVVLISAFVASAVLALDYPTRPVRIEVPFPPGGGVEATARD